MNDLVLTIIAGIGTVIGGFTGWFFRRRYETATAEEKEADAKSKIIDNEIKLSEYYKKIADDLEPKYEAKFIEQAKRYEEKFNEMVKLFEQKEKIMKDEINLLKSKNRMLIQENAALRKRNKELGG